MAFIPVLLDYLKLRCSASEVEANLLALLGVGWHQDSTDSEFDYKLAFDYNTILITFSKEHEIRHAKQEIICY